MRGLSTSILFIFITLLTSTGLGLTCRDLLSKQNNSSDARRLFNLTQPLSTGGRISLHAIKLNGIHQEKQSTMVARLEQILQAEHEVSVGPKDSLLVLNSLGDRGGFFQRVAMGQLNHLALNLVGVDSYIIRYKVSPRAPGTQKLLIVVKENVQDFREQGRSATHHQIVDGLADQLQITFTNIINESSFSFYRDSDLTFERAYQVLSHYPAGHRKEGGRMSRSEFMTAFHRAYMMLTGSIAPMDLLYMRPSFWLDQPSADTFISHIFQRTYQTHPQQFEMNFAENVSRLKQRLYSLIHRERLEGGVSRPNSEHALEATTFTTWSGDGEHLLHGPSDQYEQGYDFSGEWSAQHISLGQWADSIHSSDLSQTVRRLEQMGLRELTDLNGRTAEELINQGQLSIDEISTLARELLEYGIYLQYDIATYRQLPRDLRIAIRPPRNRNFIYNTRTNEYQPDRSRRGDRGQP